jgi:hypothetical protein
MTISYNEVWNDTTRMLRANASLVTAIAGVFLFLPSLLTTYLLPPPEQTGDPALAMEHLWNWVSQTWYWAVLGNLAAMVGALAIYLMLLRPEGRTVGETLTSTLIYIPSYILLSIIMGVIIFGGLMLLIVPGIYLTGRLAAAAPVLVAKRQLNPFAAVGESFELSRGNGWSIAGLTILVVVAGLVIYLVAKALIGSVFLVLGGGMEGIGGLLVAILDAALGAIFSTVLITLFAAIYRALSRPNSGT